MAPSFCRRSFTSAAVGTMLGALVRSNFANGENFLSLAPRRSGRDFVSVGELSEGTSAPDKLHKERSRRRNNVENHRGGQEVPTRSYNENLRTTRGEVV